MSRRHPWVLMTVDHLDDLPAADADAAYDAFIRALVFEDDQDLQGFLEALPEDEDPPEAP